MAEFRSPAAKLLVAEAGAASAGPARAPGRPSVTAQLRRVVEWADGWIPRW